jgi:hypothetical protein
VSPAAPPRTRAERKADTLAKLTAPVADAWVSSSGDQGPYLVPLSLLWHEDQIVLALDGTSRTAQNIAANGTARLALGPTRDVVLIDATLTDLIPVAEAGDVADAYATQSDWDPRQSGAPYVYLVLRPTRIQAWREANEIPGRTLMRDGVWLP